MKFDGPNWVYVGLPDFSAGTAESISLAFSLTGQPYVAYEDEGNFFKATVMYYDAPVEINELQSSQILLYPNPANDIITIETSTTPTQSQLSIMNINGQVLITRQITGPKTQIDISSLPGGVYFIRLTNERTVDVGKFIKQ
jgi:hypothetical protein